VDLNLVQTIAWSVFSTVIDVIPIAIVILVFQGLVLRRSIPNLRRVLLGFVLVLLGLAIFLVGLDLALFPLGETMARQLAEPRFVLAGRNPPEDGIPWNYYYWTYLFAFCVGFSATIAEPALLAVAMKARDASGGAIKMSGLRLAVAFGSGIGVMLGTLRIVLDIPLLYVVVAGYLIVVVQSFFAPKAIVPLAYDIGSVTTSTITVPLVTALGIGLATHIPGRDPVVDGFGMIAMAVQSPIIAVMAYAQLAAWWNRRQTERKNLALQAGSDGEISK